MTLSSSDSQNLAGLVEEVSRLGLTVDEMLALLRNVGHGGVVDIALHNRDTSELLHPTLARRVELDAKLDAADYSGFPSDTYDTLAWPASGGTVTAPADGWIRASYNSTASGQYLRVDIWDMSLLNMLISNSSVSTGSGQTITASVPVARGMPVKIIYNITNVDMAAVGAVRFIPARRAPGL